MSQWMLRYPMVTNLPRVEQWSKVIGSGLVTAVKHLPQRGMQYGEIIKQEAYFGSL